MDYRYFCSAFVQTSDPPPQLWLRTEVPSLPLQIPLIFLAQLQCPTLPFLPNWILLSFIFTPVVAYLHFLLAHALYSGAFCIYKPHTTPAATLLDSELSEKVHCPLPVQLKLNE